MRWISLVSCAALVFFPLCSLSTGKVVYVDAAASPGGDGGAWRTAFSTVGDGLAAASAGDQVWVASGVYFENLRLRSNVSLYGGFNQNESLPDDRDLDRHASILDASGALHTVVMESVAGALVDGFVLTGGRAAGIPSTAQVVGGGIYAATADASNRIRNCVFLNNFAAKAGAGMACLFGASPVVSDCTFLGNVIYGDLPNLAFGVSGGGLYIHRGCGPRVSRCLFGYNRVLAESPTSPRRGGGIAFSSIQFSGPQEPLFPDYVKGSNEPVPEIVDCTLRGNEAKDGAGLAITTVNALTLADCRIVASAGGAGIFLSGGTCNVRRTRVVLSSSYGIHGAGGTANLTDCQILGNGAAGLYLNQTAANATGSEFSGNRRDGVRCDFGTELTLERCVMSANGASGLAVGDNVAKLDRCVVCGNLGDYGIAPLVSPYAGLQMTNGLVVGNRGGILLFSDNPALFNTTFSLNRPAAGGSVVVLSSLDDTTIANCIFADNDGIGVSAYNTTLPPFTAKAQMFNCLFEGNTGGDILETGRKKVFTGAVEIAQEVGLVTRTAQGDPLFRHGATGMWTDPPQYTSETATTWLTDRAAHFAPKNLEGKLVQLNLEEPLCAHILANTQDALEVAGDLRRFATMGVSYRILDFRLRNGSAALDRGDNAYAPASDMDGSARPGADAKSDIGAFEADAGFAPLDYPFSRVSALPRWSFGTAVPVAFGVYALTDNLDYVQLAYRYNGGTWMFYPGRFSQSPIEFDASLIEGRGHYEFFTVAHATGGAVEPVRAAADAETSIYLERVPGRVYVDGDATGDESGRDWANAAHEIQLGIGLAAYSSATEVWVAEGEYRENLRLLDIMRLYGGFAGTETTLGQQEPKAHRTVVQPQSDPQGTGTVAWGINLRTSRLDGFVLTGGEPTARTDVPSYGSGLHLVSSGTDVLVSRCEIVNNTGTYGGGVVLEYCNMDMEDCLIAENHARGNGGGVWSKSTLHLGLTRCRILGNVADGRGGGVYRDGQTSSEWAAVAMNACVVAGNAAQYGGGLCVEDGWGVDLRNCIISGNRAQQRGGGVAVTRLFLPGVQLALFNSMISGNQCGSGGGGLWVSSSSHRVQVTNCAVTDNMSNRRGGGVWAEGTCPDLVNTIVATSFPTGIEANVLPETLSHNLWYGNANGDYLTATPETYIGAAALEAHIPGATGNVDGDPRFAPWEHRNVTGAPVYDPLRRRTVLHDSLGNLVPGGLVGRVVRFNAPPNVQTVVVANGTDTVEIAGDFHNDVATGQAYDFVDYRPSESSPAIDAGTSGAGVPDRDILGLPRPFGPAPDIGVYEYAPGSFPQAFLLTRDWGMEDVSVFMLWDVAPDGRVDQADLMRFCEEWHR